MNKIVFLLVALFFLIMGCLHPNTPIWNDEREAYFQAVCSSSSREEFIEEYSKIQDSVGTGEKMIQLVNRCYDSGGCWTGCGSACDPFVKGNIGKQFDGCIEMCVPLCICPEENPVWDSEIGCTTI